MAEKKMEWELFTKLTIRVAALEAENKLLKDGKGLFICCSKMLFSSLTPKIHFISPNSKNKFQNI
jgi:hypothetical protein